MLKELVDQQIERISSLIESGEGHFWARLRQSHRTFVVLICCVAVLQLRGVPRKISNSMFDAVVTVQQRVAPPDVRLVTITDEDYNSLFSGRSPLDMFQLQRLLQAIWRGGPDAIVVDLDTSHPSFAALAEPHEARIIWGVDVREAGEGKVVPEAALAGRPMPSNWSSGIAAVPNDSQGVVRSYRREFETVGGSRAVSLPLAAAQTFRRDTRSTSGGDRLLDFRYQFPAGGPPEKNPLSATSVLRSAETPGWPGGLLRGKVVVLGGTYRAARDSYATPVGRRPGSEIIAQATQAEISGTGIPPRSPWFVACIEFLGGALLIILYQQINLRMALLVSLLVIPALSVAASLILFHRLALWITIIPLLIAVLASDLYFKAALLLDVSKRVKEAVTSAKTQ
jgi:CHASE2 domain-containing sensor protein